MTDATEIFERLKEDHDRHRELLDKLLETTGDSPDRQSLFEELTKELKSHAAAEEQARCQPIYEEMPGWSESTEGARSWADLPANAVSAEYSAKISCSC